MTEASEILLTVQRARGRLEPAGDKLRALLPVDCPQELKELIRQRKHVDEYRREHLLPDTETLEKVQRYESHLCRVFRHDLHELQRLQAMRQGLQVVAPIAIDVDVGQQA